MNEQEIFLAALDKDPSERAAFLDEACGGDAALRRGVETLLRLHTECHSFLAVPAVEQLAAASSGSVNAAAELPAEQQVEAVARRLKELNPRFGGPVEPTIRDGVVTGLRFNTDRLDDLSPVRALRRLEMLDCRASIERVGPVADLSPLRGLPLRRLLFDAQAPLAGHEPGQAGRIDPGFLADLVQTPSALPNRLSQLRDQA
jgi:hypothetical protein